jgi:hypothetical protein
MLLCSAGCRGDSALTEWEVQRQVTGDTTTVLTISGQVWPADVRVEDDLTIGQIDGPSHFLFGEISRVAEDSGGGIYVFDRQIPEIRQFDRTGEFLGTIGRSGEGPGEYGSLSLGMVVDSAGVLYVHDWASPVRVLRFAEDGSSLGGWTLDSPFLTTTRGTWLYSDGPGRVLVTGQIAGDPVLFVLEGGQLRDTLTVPQLPGVPEQRGGPYRVEMYWRMHPDGYFVVGVNNEYTLEAHRAGGMLRIRRDVEARPVHPEEADAWRRRFEWMESQPAYTPPQGEWISSTMPPFREIEVGSDGRIWVRRNTHPIQIPVPENPDGAPGVGWEQPFVYDVFEADGTLLGELRFPERFEPHLFRAGYVWGVRRGEFDEQYVVRVVIRGAD